MDHYLKVMEKPEVTEAPIPDGYCKLHPEVLEHFPIHPQGEPVG